MAQMSEPFMVIGVDFGMTQTGVVWCTVPWTNPKVFQQWSAVSAEKYDKVPSRVSYDRRTGHLRAWGFGCDPQDVTADLRHYFKLHLDPDYKDEYQDLDHHSATRYYVDFLRAAHDHLVQFFLSRFPAWRNRNVQWLFSVPTTWHNPATIHTLEDLIRSAGYGSDGPLHSCRISLTEAEAAAVYVAGQDIQKDDVMLICDAGGGTTDVNILKLMSSSLEPLRLQPLLKVEGCPIGSALIDMRVEKHLENRLGQAAQYLQRDADHVAEKMMKSGRFENFKCQYGDGGYDVPQLKLAIPDMAPGIDIPKADIFNSQIGLTQATLRQYFDEQVENMIHLIDDQIQTLQRTNHTGETISYLIVSGGLGSSPYVRSRLEAHYRAGDGSRFPNARRMVLMLAENPQLAPAYGLVLDRAQEIRQGVIPIEGRIARVSYGLVVNAPYSQRDHIGARVWKDPRDGKRYAIGQIDWLISQGDRLSSKGVEKVFVAKIQPTQLKRPWQAQFVLSKQENHRPKSVDEAGVEEVCVIEAPLDKVSREVRNQHWWNKGPVYEAAKFVVKLIPGSADLKFQLWTYGSNGQLISHDHRPIEVKWGVARHQSTGGADDFVRGYLN